MADPDRDAPPGIDIRPLGPDSAILEALTGLLVATVAGGGSVGFMDPLDPEEARAFWRDSLAAAQAGRRVVFGAFDLQAFDLRACEGPALVATVTLVTDLPPNQPHRAEIAKMMTRPSHRGRGIARALLAAAEARARAEGRTLLVLDTAEEDGASGLYEKQGFVHAGTIPDFALKPQGGLTGTRLYWKRLRPVA
ncbi:GNAT family N-acetyltransferase [Ancylobacter sp. 6x-1]|uniref:GNAT family N-acetyltransferase n=1 Tax=Ancylobacter crimeensis TaxID=2579147 RepID=A0ABT0DEU5_9HYPH|nr:GNAT family N-acetyltransferase [Ancylobacter crimeensis]MCK0198468.1 GNAT family N-acetyltransferase [Ancylobacter crimeensis]